MAGKHKVKVTVQSITKGACSRGFKPGDSWIIEDGETPSGMCGDAYISIAPAIRLFWLGGEQPWDKNTDTTYRSCPDAKVMVVYEIKKLH
ncbi:TIGR04076 family protein [Chloroflexota bacterium]